MFGFTEIADRVWLARHEWFDVNTVVIGGSAGVAVVDTLSTADLGRELLAEARSLSGNGQVVAAINTHQHFDHTFGNSAFADAGVEVVAHEAVSEMLAEHHASVVGAARDDLAAGSDKPFLAGLAATELALPSRTFSSVTIVPLGDRAVELVHTGRGHSAGDVVIAVPDANVLLAGDLIEEAGDQIPGFGVDCWPLEWPHSLEVAISLTTAETTIVPGHGDPVNRQFAEDQHQRIAGVAQLIHQLAGSGVCVDDALQTSEWPWPTESLAIGIRRGYDQLPRGSRRLPLA